MTRVLEIENLSYYYEKGPALKNVSLTLEEGDYIAILGPNGGGKTTLLKCMLGLLSPQQGSIRIFGEAPHKACSRIGYVPQYSTARGTLPVSVVDAVLMGAVTHKSTFFRGHWKRNAQTQEKAQACLSRVGLEGYDNKRLADLSGGQRQRVIVARALMNDPKLLLLDEPTANIDPQGKFCFYEFLADLPKPITTVVVSHDLSIAASAFSGIAVVNQSLAFTKGGHLTPELLGRLYGEHDPSCPMGAFISNASHLLPTTENTTTTTGEKA